VASSWDLGRCYLCLFRDGRATLDTEEEQEYCDYIIQYLQPYYDRVAAGLNS
jgi:hypothetical protein